jgi:hypothetical protein
LDEHPAATACRRDLDPESKLAFIRLRTKKVEYMIAPDPDFTLIVVQHVEQNA